MVAPLIVGAAIKTTSTVARKKAGKRTIAQRRQRRADNSIKPRRQTADMKRKANGAVRRITPYIDTPQEVEQGAGGKALVKKTMVLARGITALGSTIFPMLLQTVSALFMIKALEVEDSWWGWIDFIDASLTMAGIFWLTATLLGTYTMCIAIFIMGKYIHITDWKMALMTFMCFSANWVPGIQVIPWTGIWIGFIILYKK